MVKGLFNFMFGLGFNGCFVIGALCLNGVTIIGVISSVGHLRSDSIRLLMMDGRVHIWALVLH
jgi:hypothetical protein